MDSRQQSIETLKESHDFPCDFHFKVIGTNSDEFIARVVQVGVSIVGAQAEPDVTTRESSEGKYVSVTMQMKVEDPETILDVYENVESIDDVRFLL